MQRKLFMSGWNVKYLAENPCSIRLLAQNVRFVTIFPSVQFAINGKRPPDRHITVTAAWFPSKRFVRRVAGNRNGDWYPLPAEKPCRVSSGPMNGFASMDPE